MKFFSVLDGKNKGLMFLAFLCSFGAGIIYPHIALEIGAITAAYDPANMKTATTATTGSTSAAASTSTSSTGDTSFAANHPTSLPTMVDLVVPYFLAIIGISLALWLLSYI